MPLSTLVFATERHQKCIRMVHQAGMGATGLAICDTRLARAISRATLHSRND